MARKSKRQRNTAPQQSQGSRLSHWWRPACLCFAAALLVATPLVPSERTELTGNALPYVMLWLLLALLWFAGAALLGVPLAKMGWIDAIVVALAGWHVVSGLVMMYHGAPRLAINAMWTWVSFAVIVVLLRQLVRGHLEARALCALMIALVVCLSQMAFYQAFITYPAQRSYYERNPETALSQAGIHAPEGSAARRQFEARLYSSEPTATFSLTNSLAGLLAPWLVLIVCIAVAQGFRVQGSGGREQETRDGGRKTVDRGRGTGNSSREPTARASSTTPWFGVLISILLIAFCLLLTRSRTAWLATMVGVTCLAGVMLWHSGRRKLVLLLCSQVTILAALMATLGVLNAIPPRITSAAWLSLKYRLEYWQSTLAMIRDYPLFGCGPGNFQNYYTTYKLPQASETISDPHNFVMELAAVAGLPALVLFVALVGLLLMRLRGRPQKSETTEHSEEYQTASPTKIFVSLPIGMLLAVILSLVTNNYIELVPLFLGGVTGGIVLMLLRPWVLHSVLPTWWPPLGIGVLLFNLLAAGGISFPGVMITLWVLIAVMTCGKRTNGWQPSPLAALVIFVPLTLGILLTCYQTAYHPVLRRQSLMASIGQNRGKFDKLYAEMAAEADPWSAQPDLFLAKLHCTSPMAQHPDLAEEGVRHLDRMLELDNYSSQAEAAAGYLLYKLADIGHGRGHRQRSIEHFERAVELYPNDAMAHAHLAVLYHYADKPLEAKESAARALELDALCPHQERKLANRYLFAEISVADGGWTDISAEQKMWEIRNNPE